MWGHHHSHLSHSFRWMRKIYHFRWKQKITNIKRHITKVALSAATRYLFASYFSLTRLCRFFFSCWIVSISNSWFGANQQIIIINTPSSWCCCAVVVLCSYKIWNWIENYETAVWHMEMMKSKYKSNCIAICNQLKWIDAHMSESR